MDELQCHRNYRNPACCNLGNYVHNTSHRAQSMALICDIFDKTALPFIKFKDLKIM